MVDRVPMTQEAYNKRRAEIEEMENVQMPKIAEDIATARAEGDLKENAEYHAQREKQGLLQARINDLKSRCLLYTSPSPRDLSTSRMPSSA